MNSEGKFWLGLWLVVFSFLAVVILGCTKMYLNNLQQMAKLGYQEVTIVGSSTTAWQKAK